jgi:hypothetical protein
VGYYAAGGTQLGKGLMVSHQVAPGSALATGASGAQAVPSDAPRRARTRVINLTALNRAERRIERATRVAARLFTMKKHGTHGLKLKRHHRRKKGI